MTIESRELPPLPQESLEEAIIRDREFSEARDRNKLFYEENVLGNLWYAGKLVCVDHGQIVSIRTTKGKLHRGDLQRAERRMRDEGFTTAAYRALVPSGKSK